MSTPRLAGRTVLLTGASGGLGEATAIRLAADGATLVLTDVDDAPVTELRDRLSGDGHVVARLDVAVEEQWAALTRTVLGDVGRLDGLVNNAGIGSIATVEEETVETWDKVMAVDVNGVWLGMKHAGPLLQRTGSGSIVNICSIMGTIGGLGNSAAYHAAKGAVRTLTKNAALHWAGTGVRVNSLHPGFIETQQLLARYGGTPRHEAMLTNTPLGRLAKPEEIASVVAFLLSDDSTYMTGSEIYADGGYTAR
jgi:3alpha(or 20beta)-hydroxysteroid dehydrogenase